MGTREKIERLEAEKLAMASTMRQSDEHLIGCQKKGLNFAEKYPSEYAEYMEANKRYNEIEEELKPLYEELAKEEADKERPMAEEMARMEAEMSKGK